MTGQSVRLAVFKSARGECVSESSHTTGVWMFRTAHSSHRNRSDFLSSPQALRAVSMSGRGLVFPASSPASGDAIGLPCGPGLSIARMPGMRCVREAGDRQPRYAGNAAPCMPGHTQTGRCLAILSFLCVFCLVAYATAYATRQNVYSNTFGSDTPAFTFGSLCRHVVRNRLPVRHADAAKCG